MWIIVFVAQGIVTALRRLVLTYRILLIAVVLAFGHWCG